MKFHPQSKFFKIYKILIKKYCDGKKLIFYKKNVYKFFQIISVDCVNN